MHIRKHQCAAIEVVLCFILRMRLEVGRGKQISC